jgi:4'-phosphopantetheinyl transferase
MNLYALQCPPYLEKKDFFSLLTHLSPEKQEKFRRYRKPESAYQVLWGELLLRALIKEKTGLSNQQIIFGKNRKGKPILISDPSLHFNLSHSGKWIFCALDTEPVGVDIEKIQDITPGLVNVSLSSQERRVFKEMLPQDRLSYFFTLWTCKESFLKAVGIGLDCLPEEFSVQEDQTVPAGTFLLHYKEYRGFCRSYAVDPGYRAAVCSFRNRFSRVVIRRDRHSVLQAFS